MSSVELGALILGCLLVLAMGDAIGEARGKRNTESVWQNKCIAAKVGYYNPTNATFELITNGHYPILIINF